MKKRIIMFLPILVILAMLVSMFGMAIPASAAAITVTKDVTAPFLPNIYYVGDTIYYEMTVGNPTTNSPTNTITDVWDTLPDGTIHYFIQNGIPAPLVQAPGDAKSYNITYVVNEANLQWIVPGDPEVPPYWGVINKFEAEGFDSANDDVYGRVFKNSQIIRPEISIEKTVDFNDDGVYSNLETNRAGQNASWNVTVCNTGHDPVYDIVVTDTNGHDFGAVFNLTVGECRTFIYPEVGINAGKVNNATAVGYDGLGNPVGPVSDIAEVVVVDARISVAPNATNPVGMAHDFTVTVEKDEGSGWVAAGGVSVNATLTGVGSITSIGPYVTDGSGEVTVTVNSTEPGIANLHASATVDVSGVDIEVSTDGYGAFVVDNEKTWVDARISIAPNATNPVGIPHTFTVTVEMTDDGTNWDPVVGINVTPKLDASSTAGVIISVPPYTTNSTGQVTVTVNSSVPGTAYVNVSASVPIDGDFIDVATNGYGAFVVDNEKTWVDARITISPSSTNAVGDSHNFTVFVEKDLGDGAGWVAADGVLVSGNISGVGNITTSMPVATGLDGKAIITITSDDPGTSMVEAWATVSVGGVDIDVATDGYGAHDIANVKKWIKPQLCIEKTVDFDGDGIFGDDETYYSGAPADWKVVVTNCGPDPVYNITVNDTNLHDFGALFNLAAGANKTFTYTTLNITADFTNTASAEGVDEIGGQVGPVYDDASVHVIAPELCIEKTVDFDGDGIFGDDETYYSGAPADWKVVVTNCGPDPVYNITVNDTNLHDFGALFNLAAGANKTFTYTTLNITADLTNTATAEGVDEIGGQVGPVYDSAAVDVINPSIDIVKYVWDGAAWQDADNPTGPQVQSCQTPTFKFVITNTGDVPLTNVTLTDTDMTSFFDNEACTIPATLPTTLAVNETKTYYGSLPWAPGQQTDTATTTGTPPAGPDVTDDNPANYFGAVQLPCPAGTFDAGLDADGNLVITYDQFPAPNDNSYGVNAVGWPKGHKFGDLVGSDHAGFQLIDPNGVVQLSFNIDYISGTTVTSSTPSGYASLGPFGGDGKILVGTLTPADISFNTSLANNLNSLGYFAGGIQVVGTSVANLLVDSPPTLDPSGTTPAAYMLTSAAAGNFTNGWDFHDTYFVTINAGKLGSIGFNSSWTVEPNESALHNSPEKPCPCKADMTPTLKVDPDGSGGAWITYIQSYNLNDNSYGTSAVGWGTKGHTFGNLVGSDKAQFVIKDNSGNTTMSFYFDYISAKSGTPSGYDTLGVTGGDGSISVGQAAWVLPDSTTSLSVDLNRLGYFSGGVCNVTLTGGTNLLVDSPPATGPLSYVLANPANFPNGWDFNNVYYVHIDGAAFGGSYNESLYTITVPSVHNSPAKECPTQVPPAPPTSPTYNNLPPVPPPPPPGQDITVGTVTVKDKDVKIKLTNTSLTTKATIQSITIAWPTSPNGQLQEIKLGKPKIYDGPDLSVSPATITTFKGTVKDRSIDKGKTDELKFHFQNNAADTPYIIIVDFGTAGSVTITV